MSEQIEGRNAVLEAFRSGKCVDKLFILDGCQDGPVRTIAREARKKDTIINYVAKERLDQLSETGAHQGVIAQVAAYEYASVEDILAKAKEKGEDPFIFILDNIEDPHNLGEYRKKCVLWMQKFGVSLLRDVIWMKVYTSDWVLTLQVELLFLFCVPWLMLFRFPSCTGGWLILP